MPWALVHLLAFLTSVSEISSASEGRMTATRKVGSFVAITCDLRQISANFLHWYRFQEDKAPQHLLYQNKHSTDKVKVDSGSIRGKYQAYKSSGNSYILELQSLDKSDSGVYSCATWTQYYRKDFSRGTKLIVTDINLNADISPKPTTFLPSVAETTLHKAGTYVCLLEKFFPDVIYVHWKEKNGNRILESQQGETMKTAGTYMKLSWLTVSGNSLDKEHQCIVKHENNKGGVDQEILFPAIKEAVMATDPTEAPVTASTIYSTKAYMKNETEQALLSRRLFREALQLQLTSTSAYYTYLLLLLKSAVYSAVITLCVFRRAAMCGTGNSSF